eukprot:5056358-Amphidinium_carterae.1
MARGSQSIFAGHSLVVFQSGPSLQSGVKSKVRHIANVHAVLSLPSGASPVTCIDCAHEKLHVTTF